LSTYLFLFLDLRLLDVSGGSYLHIVVTASSLSAELRFLGYQRHLCEVGSKDKLSIYASRAGKAVIPYTR
jgi:hypothetical protein